MLIGIRCCHLTCGLVVDGSNCHLLVAECASLDGIIPLVCLRQTSGKLVTHCVI